MSHTGEVAKNQGLLKPLDPSNLETSAFHPRFSGAPNTGVGWWWGSEGGSSRPGHGMLSAVRREGMYDGNPKDGAGTAMTPIWEDRRLSPRLHCHLHTLVPSVNLSPDSP